MDLVATYEMDLFGGQSALSLAFNNNKTEVTRFDPDTLSANRIRQLEEGLPETRWSLTGTQARARGVRWRASASTTTGMTTRPVSCSTAATSSSTWRLAYTVRDAMTFVVGAQNVFDDYPEENPDARAATGNLYSQYTPMGFNGGFWYGRFGYSFN